MGNKTLKAGLFAALAAGALWVLPMTVCAAPIFPEGISTDGESLAGKTWEDALHTAEEKVKKQADVSVALTIEDKKAETTAGELGIHWSNHVRGRRQPHSVSFACDWPVCGPRLAGRQPANLAISDSGHQVDLNSKTGGIQLRLVPPVFSL